MQAWNLVKVTAEGEHKGRAGMVVRSQGTINTVKLDAAIDKPEVIVNFDDSELQLLGS